eukprot:gene21777-25162_t
MPRSPNDMTSPRKLNQTESVSPESVARRGGVGWKGLLKQLYPEEEHGEAAVLSGDVEAEEREKYSGTLAEEQTTQFFTQDSTTQTAESHVAELHYLVGNQRKLQADLQTATTTIAYLKTAAPLEHERDIKRNAEEVYRRLHSQVKVSNA